MKFKIGDTVRVLESQEGEPFPPFFDLNVGDIGRVCEIINSDLVNVMFSETCRWCFYNWELEAYS